MMNGGVYRRAHFLDTLSVCNVEGDLICFKTGHNCLGKAVAE
jgi:hypothetical protein